MVCLLRSPSQVHAIEAKGAQAWVNSSGDQANLATAMAEVDCVVHAAGCRDLSGPKWAFEKSNIELTQNLLSAATQAGVNQFIHISAASVAMGEAMAMTNVSESAALSLRDELPYTRSKVLAEESVLAAGESGMKILILRPSFVWGDGDSIDTEIGPASHRGQFGWFSQGRYPFATCSIANLCDALQRAMQHTQSGCIFNISDREPLEFRAFMSQRLELGGFRVPTLSVPRKLAWWLGAFTETGWKYLPLPGKPPIVREMVRLMGFPFTVSVERANHELGYLAPHSIEAGMAHLLALASTKSGNAQQ